MNILMTGGLGYIGSHTALECLSEGHSVWLYDNLSNSSRDVLERLNQIAQCDVVLVEGDIHDKELLIKVLKSNSIDVVFHFAGKKSVNESVRNPFDYYHDNVTGSLVLLSAMKECNIKKLIFSSSASVYGIPEYTPIDEKHPLRPTNTYASTKQHVEQMMMDVAHSDENWKFVFLRYFNPVGAHHSGLIGEKPNGTPNNLMPYVSRVALGVLPFVSVFGDDYATQDGTGVRDYIHVVDLALGHLAALNYLCEQEEETSTFNLGTGCGFSVLDIIKAFSKVSQKNIPYKICSRREGDVGVCFSDNASALEKLKWTPKFCLEEMCSSAWKYTVIDSQINKDSVKRHDYKRKETD